MIHTCYVCGKRMPNKWAVNHNYPCSRKCADIAAGKLRPVTIKEVLEGKR